MATSTMGRPDKAAKTHDAKPIPPLPCGAVAAATKHYRQFTTELPAVVRDVRNHRARAGDIATYARLLHALSHSSPEAVCKVAAAAVLQLAQRAA